MLLNNQMEDKLHSHHHHQPHQKQQQAPLKKIVNNLANTKTAVTDDNNNNSLTCNPCKSQNTSNIKNSSSSSCSSSSCSSTSSKKAGGVVNLAFVEPLTEGASWYQPHLARDLAVRLLAEAPVGSFVVRNSRSQGATGHLALSVRVPRSYNQAGILHYLIMATEAGFRIKGFSKVFSSLSGLVVHHSVMMESLPCRLLIAAPAQQHSDGEEEEEDFADLEADPEYPGILSRLREQLSSD